MELGHYGWNRKVDIFQQHAVFLERPAPVTSSYGLLNIGDAPFDGLSSGHFDGFGQPTLIAVNLQSSLSHNVFLYEYKGSMVFKITDNGYTYIGADPTASVDHGVLNLGAPFYSGAGQFAGNANGTCLAINAPSSFIGNLVDYQVNGTSKFLIDASGNAHTAGTLTTGTGNAPFPLTSSTTFKTSDTTMTTLGTFYDGPTISCVAGTWLLLACSTIASNTNQPMRVTGKLWDGTTVVASSEQSTASGGASTVVTLQVILSAIVSPVSTTTYKVSLTSTTNSSVIKAAATDSGAGNNATWITAIRIG